MIPALWRPGRGRALGRLALLPAAAVFRVTASLRRTAYVSWRGEERLPSPALVIGNLTVGGTGKTPIAAWWARAFAARGIRPGILVHPVAGDEARFLRSAVPSAIVEADSDRGRAARRARLRGARALVLDDGFQRSWQRTDAAVVLVAAEQADMSPWPLPAGPWREGVGALRRADLVIVTRKSAPSARAATLRERLTTVVGAPVAQAHLTLAGFRRLHGADALRTEELFGRSVHAVCGIADPQPFVAQLEALGAHVTCRSFPDHHRFRQREIAALVEESRRSDYVVVTSKDAEKLRHRWPAQPDPLVAGLRVHWEAGDPCVMELLDRLAPRVSPSPPLSAGLSTL